MAQEDVALVRDEAKESMEKALRSLRAELQPDGTRARSIIVDSLTADAQRPLTALGAQADTDFVDLREDEKTCGFTQKRLGAVDLVGKHGERLVDLPVDFCRRCGRCRARTKRASAPAGA